MAFSVSSWWIEQAQNPVQAPVRRLTFTTKWTNSVYDMSHLVNQWPTMSRKVNQWRRGMMRLKIGIGDLEPALAGILNDPEPVDLYRGIWTVGVGFHHPNSGDELITVFRGGSEGPSYKKGVLSLSVQGSDIPLFRSKWGSREDPIRIGGMITGGTDHRPADLAYWLCVSGGGMDDAMHPGNEDIDYLAWASWRDRFTPGPIGQYDGTGYMSLVAQGQPILGILKEILKQSHSISWIGADGRMSFRHRGGDEPSDRLIPPDVVLNSQVIRDRFNRPGFCEALRYTESLDLLGGGVDPAWGNADYQSSYLMKPGASPYMITSEERWNSKVCWWDSDLYATGACLQRVGQWDSHLYPRGEMVLPLWGMQIELGDLIGWTKTLYSVDSSMVWTVMSHRLDVAQARVILGLEQRPPRYVVG